MKKHFIFLFLLTALSSSFSQNWYYNISPQIVQVEQLFDGSGNPCVLFTSLNPSQSFVFKTNTIQGKQMLSLVLTAKANDQKLRIYATPIIVEDQYLGTFLGGLGQYLHKNGYPARNVTTVGIQ